MNFIHQVTRTAFPVNYKFLPLNMIPSRYFCFTLEGFEVDSINVQDTKLHEATDILLMNLSKLFQLYGKRNIFDQPQLFIKPPYNGERTKIGVKVGIMDKKIYKAFIGKKKCS